MKRYRVVDFIRGFALINMIVYHGLWDAVFIFGAHIPWYRSEVGHIWQQLICMTFILVSGFCWSMGRKKVKRGIFVLGASAIVSIVTLLFMPENKILFGVLCFIGSAMLLMIPMDNLLKKINPYIAFVICLGLFFFTENVDLGYIGINNMKMDLPLALYNNTFTAYLGVPPKGFVSMDYFPLIPWLFLYIAGYYIFDIFNNNKWIHKLEHPVIKPIEWMGRNSLIIYMIHQPLIYIIMYWCNMVVNHLYL